MNIVITDPCYVKHPNGTILPATSTIYGDWSCMVYPGELGKNNDFKDWDDVYFSFFKKYNWGGLTKEEKDAEYKKFDEFHKNWVKEHTLGEFCADSGQVAVYDFDQLDKTDQDWLTEHYWCAAIIRDFNGTIETHVENDALHIIGVSDTKPFFTTQSGL